MMFYGFLSVENRSHSSYCRLSVSFYYFFLSLVFFFSHCSQLVLTQHNLRLSDWSRHTHVRAYTAVNGEWKLQMTNELIHGWFVTFFGIVDSNVIKYMRSANWDACERALAYTQKTIQHREWRRWRWAKLFICFIVIIYMYFAAESPSLKAMRPSKPKRAKERRLTFDKYLWSRIWPYSTDRVLRV